VPGFAVISTAVISTAVISTAVISTAVISTAVSTALVGAAVISAAVISTALVGTALISAAMAGAAIAGTSALGTAVVDWRGTDNYLVPGIGVDLIHCDLVVVGRCWIGYRKPADRDHIRQRRLPAGLAEAGRKHWHHSGLGRETGALSRLIAVRWGEARPG
jgi:hypothetical protein